MGQAQGASAGRLERWAAWLTYAAAAAAACFPLRSYDLFWHLATGRWIWEQGRVPRTDPFRFTSDHAPWVDHGWLFQLAMHGWERLGGLGSLVLLRAAMAVALAALLLGLVRRSGLPRGPGAALVLLALWGSRPRWMVRPEFAALVLLAALLLWCEHWRERRSPVRLALLAGLTALWANIHASALVVPPLVGLYAAGLALPRAERARELDVVLLPATSAAAILVNPYGAALYAVPWRIRNALAELPLFNPEWLPVWKARQGWFAVAVALLAALALWSALRGRLDLPSLLVAASLAALGASAVRHLGLFAVGGCAFAARSLARNLGPLSPEGRAAAALVASLGCLASLGASAPRGRQDIARWARGVEERRFPVRAAEELATRWPHVKRIYHDVAFGGYLIWRFYPERRAFLDGRNEVDPQLLAEVARARSDSRQWQALLDRHGIQGALVRYDERLRRVVAGGGASYRTTHALLFPPEEFSLVYWDDVAMLFVRRGAAEEEALAARAYRFVHPEDWRHWLERARRDPAYARAARGELERKLAEDPGCARARFLLDQLQTRPANGS